MSVVKYPPVFKLYRSPQLKIHSFYRSVDARWNLLRGRFRDNMHFYYPSSICVLSKVLCKWTVSHRLLTGTIAYSRVSQIDCYTMAALKSVFTIQDMKCSIFNSFTASSYLNSFSMQERIHTVPVAEVVCLSRHAHIWVAYLVGNMITVTNNDI